MEWDDIVNNWRAIGAGIGMGLWALAARAGEGRMGSESPGTPEAAPPSKTSPVFSEDEQRRIRELRQWLLRRQQERKLGEPGGVDALKEAKAPLDLSIPDMSRAGGEFGVAPPKGKPVLHIGRGPDGRVHHRYIFSEEGPDQLQSAAPEYTPSNRRSR